MSETIRQPPAASAFPDVAFEVADIASDADKVWARVVVTGTQRGE